MKSRLDIIEARLQALIEGSTHLLPGENLDHFLANRLVIALQESLSTGEDGQLVAPGNYTILLNPVKITLWRTEQALLNRLAIALQEAAFEAGVRFQTPPAIRLDEDANLPPDEFIIQVGTIPFAKGTTAVMKIDSTEDRPPHPESAFLIINGSEVFLLRQPVINIGRRLDNHLVIDDPRVSRNHAQIRSIRGVYVLFDLNSTGGTYVNGQRITQQALKAGDVISLAGVPVIYGEDTPPYQGDTSELNSKSDQNDLDQP